jgi:TrmH family RNA methyltransferase
MVAKSDLKYIRSLRQKKFRQNHGMFVAEGVKLVRELLDASFKAEQIYTVSPNDFPGAIPVSDTELKQMSSLVQPNKVLGVFRIPASKPLEFSNWVLALDGIRDPGNLGTLIRLCDWFGITHLICSEDTVDIYNPKVLQATMGSIARVNIHYTALEASLKHCNVPIYGASMEGTPIFESELNGPGVLVMGNEAHGIGTEVRKMLSQTVAIPPYGNAESLNVATAAAVMLYEIRRP